MNIAATRPADDQWRGRSPPVMGLGRHVHDLVKGAADEVHKLKFSNRPHAAQRSAESCPHNGHLGDRRVDHALRAEAVNETVGNLERAAINADVLAQTEHARVALHLLPYPLTNGFKIGD